MSQHLPRDAPASASSNVFATQSPNHHSRQLHFNSILNAVKKFTPKIIGRSKLSKQNIVRIRLFNATSPRSISLSVSIVLFARRTSDLGSPPSTHPDSRSNFRISLLTKVYVDPVFTRPFNVFPPTAISKYPSPRLHVVSFVPCPVNPRDSDSVLLAALSFYPTTTLSRPSFYFFSRSWSRL